MIRRLRTFFLITFGALLLCSCNTIPIAQDLNQQQATNIVAVLGSRGIAAYAKRDTGGRPRYSVEVKKNYYSEAVSILHDQGLPGEPKISFQELVSQSGLIPSSREVEALRLDHALATELEEAIVNHPAIASVKAIVRLHFLKPAQDPGVALVIQTRSAAGPVGLDRSEISQLVKRVIPGISDENIITSVHSSTTDNSTESKEGILNQSGKVTRVPLASFLYLWHVPEDDYDGLAIGIFAMLIVVGVIGGVFGYWYAYYYHSRQFMASTNLDLLPRLPKGERGRKEIGER